MNYLQDKKQKRKKFLRILFFIFCFAILIYFHTGISRGLSVVVYTVFRPVVVLGNNVGKSFHNTSYFFQSKKSLLRENEALKEELEKEKAFNVNYSSILDENTKLKDTLGRSVPNTNLLLAGILSKPNKSAYDTLIIDVGTKDNVAVGNLVLAYGNIPIGHIAEVFNNSAKVILFSNSGEKMEVSLSGSDTFFEIIGRGGGNFEINVPRGFVITEGTEAVLPGVIAETVAIFEKFISDPRDSVTKALFVSPVNIQELKFVEVKI